MINYIATNDRKPAQSGCVGWGRTARQLHHHHPVCLVGIEYGLIKGSGGLRKGIAVWTAWHKEEISHRWLYFCSNCSRAYRSIGSIDQADLEVPDMFIFVSIGSGSGRGSMSYGTNSQVGIDITSEIGYMNSFEKNLMAFGRFNIGEELRWSSFSKTFDLRELPRIDTMKM